MFEIVRESMRTVIAIALIIIVTHTVFFIMYGYCMSGDPFIALRNFYNIMYYVR